MMTDGDETLDTVDPGELLWVSLDKLVTKPQTRTVVNAAADAELEDSIAVSGILQPVLVRPAADGSYVLVAGHRRVAAARKLQMTEVPAMCREMSDDEAPVSQLVENLTRLDLTLAEVSAGVWTLYDGVAGASATAIAKMLNKSKSWVSKMLMLSAPGKAHSVARKLMADDKISDLELAYLICQVEELDKGFAEAIGRNIENETRKSVKGHLAQARAAAAREADPSGADTSESEESMWDGYTPEDEHGSEKSKDITRPALTIDEWRLLREILLEAQVPAAKLHRLNQIRSEVDVIVREIESLEQP